MHSATSERSGMCVRGSESAHWLTNQIAAAISEYSPVRCALGHTSLVGFPRRASPAGPASLSSRCLQLSSTPTCWLLLIHSLTPTNAYLFSPLGHSLSQRRQGDIAGDQCSQVYSVAIRYTLKEPSILITRQISIRHWAHSYS